MTHRYKISVGIIFLLLPILFYSCTSENKKQKEIVSAKLIYSIRAGILNDEGARIDTFSAKQRDRDTILINRKEDVDKLQEIISHSTEYTGFWKAFFKYHLIIHYNDSTEKLSITGGFYKSGEKVFTAKENLGDFCRDLISKYSK